MTKSSIGIVDGMKTYAVFKEDGEAPVYSISAGLDYPGVGQNTPTSKTQVAWNMSLRRMKKLFKPWLLSQAKLEGIIPVIESSHRYRRSS